jgi:hypothetical protein
LVLRVINKLTAKDATVMYLEAITWDSGGRLDKSESGGIEDNPNGLSELPFDSGPLVVFDNILLLKVTERELESLADPAFA